MGTVSVPSTVSGTEIHPEQTLGPVPAVDASGLKPEI